MSKRLEWFGFKSYGYGSWLPISVAGWLVLAGYFAAPLILAVLLQDRLPLLFAAIAAITAVFLIIAARTTRGGWKWRWGKGDR